MKETQRNVSAIWPDPCDVNVITDTKLVVLPVEISDHTYFYAALGDNATRDGPFPLVVTTDQKSWQFPQLIYELSEAHTYLEVEQLCTADHHVTYSVTYVTQDLVGDALSAIAVEMDWEHFAIIYEYGFRECKLRKTVVRLIS